MAVINNGILGGGSGKVGPVTMTTWKGIDIVKGRPLSVANPRTAGQITQRNKFGALSKFASIILAAMIIPLMNRFAVKMSGYNMFQSLNVENTPDNGEIFLDDYTFGNGKLGDTPITSATYDVSSKLLTVNWNGANDNQFKQNTDKPYILCWDKIAQKVMFQGAAQNLRVAGTVAINNVSADIGVSDVQILLVFRRADGTMIGNTAFIEISAQP